MWSLGVIIYLLLSRVLPFDDEDDREIARQTIYDAPDFNFHPWEKVSREGRDLVKSKNYYNSNNQDCWRKIDIKDLPQMRY